MAIEHADFEGVERLAAVTGGATASTFDHPELAVLGECKKIEEVMIGEDTLIRFSGCKAGEACTIVLRGARHPTPPVRRGAPYPLLKPRRRECQPRTKSEPEARESFCLGPEF
ncbi:unnamed protein product [Ectocarpus sp. CCAP 1310/34]|nr:unnamed protein product [Ectocarpus sp. CCAP 1310/34]